MHPPRPNPLEALGPFDFAKLRALLQARTGIRLEDGKEYFVGQRLATLAVELGYDHVPRLIEILNDEPAHGPLHRHVIEALTISETSFFRDLHPFDALREIVIPRLVAARAASRQLRIWSAACASGQELYSVAVLIRDSFPELGGWDLELLGTDFSNGALRRARAGRFSPIETHRGLPAATLVRWFHRDGADWRVRDEIRTMVTFREHNLVTGSPLAPPMDLVLLRNVLMYFDTDTRRRVLELVDRSMRPDGVLVLGAGETAVAREGPFSPEEVGRSVVLRPSGPRSPIPGSKVVFVGPLQSGQAGRFPGR